MVLADRPGPDPEDKGGHGADRGGFPQRRPGRHRPGVERAATQARPIQATILGYLPRFEASSGLWYADVQVGADAVYMPFVRLAVGRYQPNSLSEEMVLSRITTIDIVQPLPNRMLTMLRHADDPEITISLWGPTYFLGQVEQPDRAARVTARLYTAESADGDHWRPVAEVTEIDLVRDPIQGVWTAKANIPRRARPCPAPARRRARPVPDQLHRSRVEHIV